MSALKNFKRWVFVMQHIHEATFYVGRAEELGHPHLFVSYDAILDFLGYFRNALNSYAKCFVTAGKGRIRLDSSEVFKYKSDLIAKHQRIIDLRHRYVAHSDANSFESTEMLEIQREEELILHLQYGISFPFDRLYELRELIRYVELWIVDKQQVLIKKVARETGKPVRIMEGGDDPARYLLVDG